MTHAVESFVGLHHGGENHLFPQRISRPEIKDANLSDFQRISRSIATLLSL